MTAQRVAENPARVEFTVKFSNGPKGRRRVREASDHLAPRKSPGRVPRIARLLVLGHHFERLVREGKVKDYAEIARLTGLTRARVTQIVNLTLLAPEIQEDILDSPNLARDLVTEHTLRKVSSNVIWQRQEVLWHELRH